VRATVTTTQKKTSWFAPKLRAELDSSDTSIRALARKWRPGDPETARRSLIRYLQNGIVPNAATRAELAEALGCTNGALEPDDEEDEPAMREAYRLFVDLMGQIDTAQQKKNARKRAARMQP
jgi:hypothetical protein